MSKKKGGKLKWVVLAVVAVGVIGAVGGNSDSNTTSSSSTSAKTESAKEVDTSTAIEYTSVSVNDMMSDLDNNAMGASDKYKGKYLEITGKLSNIDAAGKYIDLMADGDFEIIGVQCYIKNDDQKAKIASMSKGDTVTLKGKCTDVGEVLGYSLDIEEIE
jgi:hypothetical protein